MNKRKGFTLIELLVVISIIALLMAILMPALQMAKGAAISALCLHNVHTLSMAWFTYTIDNGGLLVGAYNGGSSDNHDPDHPYSWLTAPQNAAGSYVNFTTASFEDRLRGIRRGLLFPYTKDVKVYHCLADKRYKSPPEPGYQSRPFHSYSIAGGMN